MLKRRTLLRAAMAFSPVSMVALASGADWPNRAVKIVVGFPPGQSSDNLARQMAADLQQAFGQPFVVDNRPGAGATLASAIVAKAAPDGYTLLFTSTGPLTIAPHLYANLGFDSMVDLDPFVLTGRSPQFLLVRPDFPAKTLPELVALSKANELQAGSSGNGATTHLSLELFKTLSGAKLLHVPYKGSAHVITDLMGGQIQTAFESSGGTLGHVKAGRLRPLAVTSTRRHPDLPDVPTVAEFYPGFDVDTWCMFAAPRGTPEVIKNKISAQLNKWMSDPAVKEKLMAQGVEATPGSTPAKTRAYAQAEYEKWGSVIRRANVRLE